MTRDKAWCDERTPVRLDWLSLASGHAEEADPARGKAKSAYPISAVPNQR
jgi:hypothetical protein